MDFLWEALGVMFEHDRSAARGEMTTRGLVVFRHDSGLGNARAHDLFDRVTVARRNGVGGVPRSFQDYEVTVDDEGLSGVQVRDMLSETDGK